MPDALGEAVTLGLPLPLGVLVALEVPVADAVALALGVADWLGLGVGLCVPDCDRVPVALPVADTLGDPVELGELVCVRVREPVVLGVSLALWDRVAVRLGVCVPVRVPVPVRVSVWLRVSVSLAVSLGVWLCVCVDDGEQTSFSAVSHSPGYESSTTQLPATPLGLENVPMGAPNPDTGAWLVMPSFGSSQKTASSEYTTSDTRGVDSASIVHVTGSDSET